MTAPDAVRRPGGAWHQVPGAEALWVLLSAPDTTDVLVNGSNGVWVDRGEGLRQVAVDLGGTDRIRALAVQLAAVGGRRLDDACPAVDVALPGGVRLHAVLAPIAREGPLLSLRVLRRRAFTLEQLSQAGTLPGRTPDLLRALMAGRANVLISGATGTGKTTLLSALLEAVDPTERIVVIEEAAELSPAHPHVVRLEARRANVEGRGSVSLTELVRHALRMRPDRIVLGECRGAEVREVLTALNTGHAGSCATVHANTAGDVPARLAALGSLAGLDRAAVAAQAAAALDAVVQLRRESAGGTRGAGRRLEEIGAVTLTEAGSLCIVPALEVGATVRRGPGWDLLAGRFSW